MISREEFKRTIFSGTEMSRKLKEKLKPICDDYNLDIARVFNGLVGPKKFVDEEFARWCSDHNTKWSDANFFMSGDVNTLSNCCRLLSDTSKLDAFKKDSANKKDIEIVNSEIEKMYNEFVTQEARSVT